MVTIWTSPGVRICFCATFSCNLGDSKLICLSFYHRIYALPGANMRVYVQLCGHFDAGGIDIGERSLYGPAGPLCCRHSTRCSVESLRNTGGVMDSFIRKLAWLARRRDKEAELQEELQFHLDEEAEERGAGGLDAEQARLAARRDLGN